jgi:hypothetical protein
LATFAGCAAAKVSVHAGHEGQRRELRAAADYAEQIARSATDGQKRELYERLAVHFRQLAGDIEKAMADRRE